MKTYQDASEPRPRASAQYMATERALDDRGLKRIGRAVSRLQIDAPGYTACAVLLALLALPTLLAEGLDARAIDDVGIWRKPLKFQLALFVYCLTLAFYARFVPERVRQGRAWRLFTGVVIAAIIAEMLWLMFASSLGQRSHFNFTHPVLSPLYPVMGVLATVLTAATAQYAWAIGWHARELSPVLKGGLVWGLGLTLPLTVVTAFYLSAGSGHHVLPDAAGPLLGSRGSDAGGLLLFGWSRTGGDLRVAHFFATHALHAVPLISLALSALGWKSLWAARLAALLWTGLVVHVFVGALDARPFLASL